MDVPYYAEMFHGKGIPPNSMDITRRCRHYKRKLEFAIKKHNMLVMDGGLRGYSELVPEYHYSAYRLTRTVEDQTVGIMRSAGFGIYELNTAFPGLVSIDMDSAQVKAFITRDNYIRNRPQKMRFGKYLRKTGMYNEETINSYANTVKSTVQMQRDAKLSWAETSEEIVDVYKKGPNSCMSGDSFGHLVYHPAYVYGTEDIRCAYVKIDGRITARALCNEEAKAYSTTYGNDYLIEKLLEDAGYSSGDLDGCAIKAISVGSGVYLMPYIDGADEVALDGDHFIIGGYGDYRCDGTNGTTENGHCCEYCGDMIPEDDAYYIEQAEMFVCDTTCAEEMGYVILADSYDFAHMDDCVWCETDEQWYDQEDSGLAYVEDVGWYLESDDRIVYCECSGMYNMAGDCVWIGAIDSWCLISEMAEYYEKDEEEEYA